jgi:hypothetical protein
VLATASVSFVLALYDGNWAHDVKRDGCLAHGLTARDLVAARDLPGSGAPAGASVEGVGRRRHPL